MNTVEVCILTSIIFVKDNQSREDPDRVQADPDFLLEFKPQDIDKNISFKILRDKLSLKLEQGGISKHSIKEAAVSLSEIKPQNFKNKKEAKIKKIENERHGSNYLNNNLKIFRSQTKMGKPNDENIVQLSLTLSELQILHELVRKEVSIFGCYQK